MSNDTGLQKLLDVFLHSLVLINCTGDVVHRLDQPADRIEEVQDVFHDRDNTLQEPKCVPFQVNSILGLLELSHHLLFPHMLLNRTSDFIVHHICEAIINKVLVDLAHLHHFFRRSSLTGCEVLQVLIEGTATCIHGINCLSQIRKVYSCE